MQLCWSTLLVRHREKLRRLNPDNEQTRTLQRDSPANLKCWMKLLVLRGDDRFELRSLGNLFEQNAQGGSRVRPRRSHA